MNKSGYNFRIQRAEIDKEDIKQLKQGNHCRPVLFVLYSICMFVVYLTTLFVAQDI
jgi:hypothetical protein